MDSAAWLAALGASGLIPTMARMNEELLLHEQGFEPRPVVGDVLEVVWEAPAWMDVIGGHLFARRDAVGIAREFAAAGVNPEGEAA